MSDLGDLYLVRELQPPPTTAGSWTSRSIRCEGAPTLIRRPSVFAVVRLRTSSPAVRCTFDNAFIPSAELRVNKVIRDPGGLRNGPVRVGLRCTDGTEKGLDVPPGDRTGALDPLFFLRPTTCTVRETTDGAGDNVSTGTSIRVARGTTRAQVVNGSSTTFRLEPGDDVRVTVVDTYRPPSPSPSPKPTPSNPASAGSTVGHDGAVPPTGSNIRLWWILLGIALVGAGAAVTTVAFRRR